MGVRYQVQWSLSLFLGVVLEGLSPSSLVLTSQLVLGCGPYEKAAPGPVQSWELGMWLLGRVAPWHAVSHGLHPQQHIITGHTKWGSTPVIPTLRS